MVPYMNSANQAPWVQIGNAEGSFAPIIDL